MVASKVFEASLQSAWKSHHHNVHNLDAWELSQLRDSLLAVEATCCPRSGRRVLLTARQSTGASGSKFHRGSKEACQMTREHRKVTKSRHGSALRVAKTGSPVQENAASRDVDEDIAQEEEHFHKLTHRSNSYWADVMQRIIQQEPAEPSSSQQLNGAGPKRTTSEATESLGDPVQDCSTQKVGRGRKASNPEDEPSRTENSQDRPGKSEGTPSGVFDAELRLSLKQLLRFERKGHVCVRGLVQEAVMEEYAEHIWIAAREQEVEAYRHRVAVLCPMYDADSISSVEEALGVLDRHSSEELGFLQMFNLHRYSKAVRTLVTSPRLAKSAAELLGASKVRLYQDCLFLKHPGFGATNWHSDLNMVPLDTNSFVTFWIPLRSMDEDDSGLLFASGSHRDFALPYWQDLDGMEDLAKREYKLEGYGALELGDATCHHGWCLHYAMPQPEESEPRAALSISYFADGAKVLNTRQARRSPHDEDAWSYREWRQCLQEDDVARHDLLPVVYPASPQQLRSKKRKLL